jgi:hypothetical protein
LGKFVLIGKRPVEDAKANDPYPSVRLDELAKSDFDVRGRVADFFIENEYVMFNRLANATLAYFATFRIAADKQKRTCNAIKDIFAASREEMRLLELIRNLYAHKGGRVDQQFLDAVKGTEFENLELRSQFPIHGELVFRFVNHAVDLSVKLVRFIEKWLLNGRARVRASFNCICY